MKSNEETRVVVGLSGGVDSSVTAYLLKEQGYDVVGIFMRNWNDDSVILDEECPWVEDSADALLVAEKLNIPFQVIDLSEIYKDRIVDYMFDEYEKGRTPNPDVLCNREIKFDVFLKTALELGADFVATGHYCQKETIATPSGDIHKLIAGNDSNKDQSYFLCQLSQEQLSKAMFPIGHLAKPEVRKVAEEQGLATAHKKDSQGLCFIGKVRLPDFLQQKLKPKKGEIIEISSNWNGYDDKKVHNSLAEMAQDYTYTTSDGKVVGQHNGAHYFTRGQRKGLAVGGTPLPLFVLDTDVSTNHIYVGQGTEHPGLYKKALYIANEELHWVREDMAIKNGETLDVEARIRYRQEAQKASLYKVENGMYVSFSTAQKAISPGQFCAWYIGKELIGSGVIA